MPVKVRGVSGNILVYTSFTRMRITLGKFKLFACLRVVDMRPYDLNVHWLEIRDNGIHLLVINEPSVWMFHSRLMV